MAGILTTRWFRTLLLVAALLQAEPSAAQPAPAAPTTPPAAPVTVTTAGGDVSVIADRMEQTAPDLMVATGNVEMTRGTTRLFADRVEINRLTGDTVATGHVIFYDGDDQLSGERIEYNIKSGTGVVYEARARAAPYYRIDGERMERLSDSRYHLRRGILTTCEADPPDWSVHLGDADVDLEDSVFGRDASLWLKDIPVIPWFPFFAAAIRKERQTGFLFPRFGQSTKKGFYAELPFYWAISDSQDATVTVSEFSRRGPALSAEYRYVLSTNNRGIATGFVVDELQRSGSTQDDLRGWYGWKHNWAIAPGLVFKADVNGVSDDNVLREYSDTLPQRSLQRVESNVFITRTWENWNFVGNLFWYQDLTTAKGVELNRLPDLRVTASRQPLPGLPGSGLLYEFEGSVTKFVREVGSDGDRFDFHPRLSRPVSVAGYFTVTPFLGGRLTGYDRTVVGTGLTSDGLTAVEVTRDENRLRSLLEVGTDVEARAIRIYQVGGWGGWEAFLHSIEPRVNFTSITGHNTDPDKLPLWTEQIDRIPESRRIEYSVTNRIRARSEAPAGTEAVRVELARLLIGSSWDLLLGRAENIISEMLVQPSEQFKFRSDATLGVHGEGLQIFNADMLVTVPHFTGALGYRQSRQPGSNTTGTIIAPAVLPVPGTTVSRTAVNFLQGGLAVDVSQYLTTRYITNYDLRSGIFVENRFGIDVRFQCYGFTVEYVQRNQSENEVRFTLNLLGVGGPLTTSTGLGALGAGSR